MKEYFGLIHINFDLFLSVSYEALLLYGSQNKLSTTLKTLFSIAEPVNL